MNPIFTKATKILVLALHWNHLWSWICLDCVCDDFFFWDWPGTCQVSQSDWLVSPTDEPPQFWDYQCVHDSARPLRVLSGDGSQVVYSALQTALPPQTHLWNLKDTKVLARHNGACLKSQHLVDRDGRVTHLKLAWPTLWVPVQSELHNKTLPQNQKPNNNSNNKTRAADVTSKRQSAFPVCTGPWASCSALTTK